MSRTSREPDCQASHASVLGLNPADITFLDFQRNILVSLQSD